MKSSYPYQGARIAEECYQSIKRFIEKQMPGYADYAARVRYCARHLCGRRFLERTSTASCEQRSARLRILCR
jgi:hypothetical protein